MIVKWLKKTGNGSAGATVDYMLGKNRDRAGATAFGGVARAEHTALLADSLKHKHKYAVGVLSFEEAPSEISNEKKLEIIESFEQTIFAGLDREQYNIAWIEHTDKNRLELNFIIPKVELRSGRAMNPYLHGKDTPLIDCWKNIINAEHGLSDPNDPAKRHTTTKQQRLPKDKKELADAIDGAITIGIEAGKIKDRAGVIKCIESFDGLKVTKTTKQSISVHHEDMGARPLRLTGAYYEQDFTASSIDQEYIAARSEEYRARAAERLRTDKEEYQRLLESRSKYNQSRYSQPAEAISSTRYRRDDERNRSNSDTDRTTDREATAANQRAIDRAGSADSAGYDHGAKKGSSIDHRSDLAHEKHSQQYRYAIADDAAGLQPQLEQDADRDRQGVGIGGITTLECGRDDQASATGAEQARTDLRQNHVASDSDRQRSGGYIFSSGTEYTQDGARAGAGSAGHSTAHERTTSEHQQDDRQYQRINGSETISAHILPPSDDSLGGAAADGDNDRQLQYVQQLQNIERPSAADQPTASDIVRLSEANQRSDSQSAGQPSYDRADSAGYINQITTPSADGHNTKRWQHTSAESASIIDQEITDNGTVYEAFRTTFKRIRDATTRAARAAISRVRSTVAAAIAAIRPAGDTDRDIDNIIAAIERRERNAAPAHSAAGASERQADDRDRELEQYRSSTAQDDQRAEATDRAIERDSSAAQATDRDIERTERQIIDTDRDIATAQQRIAEQSQYINWIDRQVQNRVQSNLEQERQAEQQREAERLERIRLAELEEERQRKADNEYSSPSPFD